MNMASNDSDGTADALQRLQAALAARDAELASLQGELDETNRGVLALYAELDTQA